MSVTFAVFHLERSELNTDAPKNAVEVNAMVDPIQNKSRRRTKKWGKGEKTEFEGRNKERKHKEVQWTYFLACSSPLPCSTWKDPH